MRFQILLILATILTTSGCIASNDVDRNLNEIATSQDEVPEGFELTHQTNADSSDFEDSSIIRRVDRRFVKNTTNRTRIVLSSATVYDSEEAAIRVRRNFLNRTGTPFSEPEEVYYSNKKATHIPDITYAPLKRTHYIYRRNGSLIYFVGVTDSENPRTLAELLFKDMRQAE